MDRRWLTTEEVAERLELTTGRVRQIARSSGIGMKVGRDWLFTPEDVEAIRSRNTQRGRPALKQDSPGA